MQVLLSFGSDVLLQDDQGYTPLHLAAAWGHSPACVEILLNAGSNICAVNRNFKTPADISQSHEASLILHGAACQPCTLKYLCVIAVRKMLGCNLLSEICQLPVPECLKKCILNVSLAM